MSGRSRGRATDPFAAVPVDRITEPPAVRVRSGLTLLALVIGLAVLAAVAMVALVVAALALATTATS